MPSFKINGCTFDPAVLEQTTESNGLFISKFMPGSISGATSGEQWENDLFLFLKEWFNRDEYIRGKTSGSTGTPKDIKLSKKAMVASALRTNSFFHIEKDAKLLLCLPVNYIAGKMMVVRAITGGVDLITVSPSSQPDWNEKIDFAAMVPMQVQSLMESRSGINKLNTIRKLIIGGSPVSPTLEKRLCELSTSCYLTYGMTETVSHVALCNIEKDSEHIYRALPDIHFRQDERDCLIIDAPYLQPEPIVTNDIVRLISETSFSWIGRWDNIINSGGVKISPEAVENKISDLIKTRFYIASVPHELLGQQVVLKIEDSPWNKDTENIFYEKIKTRLSRYEVPKQIIFQEKFEETSTGKMKRHNS
jgi:O-succinylbenzoic acid--CoA ligase